MNRILTISLLASSMLIATAPVLAQERGNNRGEWSRGQMQQQQNRPDRGERQRPQRMERIERAQQAPQQRGPSAVRTEQVRPSTAQSNWRQNREGQARPERSGENRRFEGRRPDAPSGVVTPQTQRVERGERDGRRDWNRDNAGRPDRNWTTENRRPGVVTNRDFDRNRGDDARRQRDWRNDRDGRDGRNWSNGDRDRDRSYNYQGRLNDRDRWSGQRRWDNNGWRNDRRYDWQRHRTQYRQVYRQPRYAAPYGWDYGYRRFSIGISLNSILFGSSYWINDPYRYRLPPAYGTLRWVRYYDDAMLVDIRDGYVVDVLHDFFW